MNDAELERKRELLEIHRRRKHELDKQVALRGLTTEPHILIEQQDLAKTIQELEREIAKLHHLSAHHSPFIDPYNKALILDVAKIIDFPVQRIEFFLGSPTDVSWRKIGSADDLPDGGETHEYTFGKYTVWINYNKSAIATGVRLFEGLEEENYTLADWPVILERVGLMSAMRPPDVQGLTTWTWLNHLGYRIAVATQRVNGPVTAVRVHKLPK